jgi:hypothetical protein
VRAAGKSAYNYCLPPPSRDNKLIDRQPATDITAEKKLKKVSVQDYACTADCATPEPTVINRSPLNFQGISREIFFASYRDLTIVQANM